MVIVIKQYMCEKCMYISTKKFIECPACSNEGSFIYPEPENPSVRLIGAQPMDVVNNNDESLEDFY